MSISGADETFAVQATYDGKDFDAGVNKSAQAVLGLEAANKGVKAELGQFVKASSDAGQAAQALGSAERQAAASAAEMGEAHALSYRTINRAAGEGSRGVSQAMMVMQTGALDSAGAMDVFRIAMGAAFHGPETLLIVAAAVAVGALVEKLQSAAKAAHDVKWFGDEAEVTARYDALSGEYAHLLVLQQKFDGNRANEAGIAASYDQAAAALKKQVDHAGELQDKYQHLAALDEKINELKSARVAIEARGKLAEAEAGSDPLARMKASHDAELELRKTQQEESRDLVNKGFIEIEILKEQKTALIGDKTVDQLSKEQQKEYGAYKVAIDKKQEQINQEVAMYSARNSALVSLEAAFGLELQTERTKTGNAALDKTLKSQAAAPDRRTVDSEAGEEGKYKAELEARASFNKEMDGLAAEAVASQVSIGADEYSQKFAQLDLWYEKQKSTYEKEAADEAARSGDSVTAAQRLAEKLELVDSIAANKRRSIEADRVKKTEELNSGLTASLISDSANFLQVVSGHNKALFLAEKALAAAEVVIQTEVAAAKIEAQLGIAAALGPEELLYAGMAVKLATIAATAIQGYAGGTDNFGGGLARINEGGLGEIVNLPSGTQIIPHDVSMAMAKNTFNNRGGDVHIGQVVINGSGLNQEQLTAAVADAAGALASKGWQEGNRGARFFDDGTLG